MSVTVDSVVTTMLAAGGEVIICDVGRIVNNLGVPHHVSSPWLKANRLLVLETYDLFINIMSNWVVRIGDEAIIGRLTNILNKMELLAVADAVSRLGNPETRISLSSVQHPQTSTYTRASNSNANTFPFGVKHPIHKFVGRADVLQQLNDYFVDQTHRCVVIYAIGGQGKTELCKQFIHNLITSNSPPPVVVWLPGGSIQGLASKVSKLARRLSISTDDDTGKTLPLVRLLKKVAKQINIKQQSWLVVVDNVDEEDRELEKIVQILIEYQAFVLITSRRNDVFSGAATQLKLETLSLSDAMLLVRNTLTNAPENDVVLLCDIVGNHALALQQSVAYIRMQMQISTMGDSYGISDFLQKFQDYQKSILQHRVKLVNYDHTIHAIVHAALDIISLRYGKTGQSVLALLGLVHPDGVHLDILQKLHNICVENRPNTEIFPIKSKPSQSQSKSTSAQSLLPILNDPREAVLLLAKFSVVSLKDEVVSIHRLVQMVLRLECQYEQTINISLKHIQPKDSSLKELRQLISIWEYADHKTVKLNPDVALKIFNRMFSLSLLLELNGFAEKNHTLLSQLLGPNHEESLSMEYSVAHGLLLMGDYEDALAKLQILLEKVTIFVGEGHLLTTMTVFLISKVLEILKTYEDAPEWIEKVVKPSMKVFCRNQINTMIERNNTLLLLSDDHGRNEDEELSNYQQLLLDQDVEFGPYHVDTLTTRFNIACILFNQEHFHEAMTELEAIMKLEVQTLGEEHVYTLTTKFCLANTFWKLNMREDSMKMLEEVLVSQEKVLGDNHVQTNITRHLVSVTKGITKQDASTP